VVEEEIAAMKIRGLLVAIGLLVVLAGGIWYSSRAGKGKDPGAKAEATPNVLTLKEGDIIRVDLGHHDGETTVLEKDATGGWKITAPVAYPVDRDAVSALLAAVATVASDKVVDDKAADLSQYGLTAPALSVIVGLKDGKSKKIAIGDATSIGSAFYASAQGDSHVYTVATYTKEALDKSSADLRDRRLLTFNSDKLARVVLASNKTETEFGRNAGGDWQIVKPKPYRADVFAVDDLVRRLKEFKLDPALSMDDQKKTIATFGSAALMATVTVTDAAGSQKLEIRKAKDDKYYASSSVVAGVYAVEAATAKAFDKTTDDFRNKKIFDFGFNDPSRVDYHSTKRQATVSKAGEKWFRGGKPLDSNSIQTFIDKLRDLSATKFAESPFGAAEVEITVVSSDGKKAEKVSLAKSGALSGSDWLVRRDGDASIYVIPATTVDELEHAAADLKEDQSRPPTKK
jgi:hypothetical protein